MPSKLIAQNVLLYNLCFLLFYMVKHLISTQVCQIFGLDVVSVLMLLRVRLWKLFWSRKYLFVGLCHKQTHLGAGTGMSFKKDDFSIFAEW